MHGTIIKAVAGFYYVAAGDGMTYQCRARGIFKKQGITPLVGDEAEIEKLDEEEAVINEIESRKNEFIRPPVANVDLMAIVASIESPEPSTLVIDRLMVMTEKADADIILCINKIDLDRGSKAETLKAIYKNIYPVFCVSGMSGNGMPELKKFLQGRKTALAGASGVGKSTILNCLAPYAAAQTGGVSRKTDRGKNTTRHVELFRMDNGGMVYDTPGFTSLDITGIDAAELQQMYPEMQEYAGECRYSNCRHISEPGCAVREAVEKGKIDRSRYASYLEQHRDIENLKKY